MLNKVILGFTAVCLFGGGLVVGIFVERRLAAIPASKPNPPAAPALLSPADGAVLKGSKLAKPLNWEFIWSEVSGAERYHIEIIRGPNLRPQPPEFANLHEVPWPEVVTVVKEPRYLHTDPPPPWLLPLPISSADFRPKGWTWKVKAQVGGQWSEWSEVRTFEVEIPSEWK